MWQHKSTNHNQNKVPKLPLTKESCGIRSNMVTQNSTNYDIHTIAMICNLVDERIQCNTENYF